MEDVKVSVIIPVYNMENYLECAIESVEKQTLTQKEIICIDDGSTDDTYHIAMECALKYSNVHVFQQRNMGAGAARNLGIQKSQGEFVCFLDADDFYASEDVLEYLYNLAKEKRVNICGGSSCDYKDGVIGNVGIRKERVFVENQYIKKEDYPGMTGYWAFIYNRMFLQKNGIFFPPYMRGQDAPFFVKAIACAGGVYCSKKNIYIYRKDHKKVHYDETKSLGYVYSLRDVLKIAIENGMCHIQKVVCEELKGEAGALIYKFLYEDSASMYKVVKEINQLIGSTNGDGSLLCGEKLLLEDNEINLYMQENENEKEFLLKTVRDMKYVFVFGAGTIGRKVAHFLQDNQIRVDAYIVSDVKQNPSVIEDVSVKDIDEIEGRESESIVIIATFWYSQKDIIEILKRKNISNIYSIDLRRFYLWQQQIEH